MERNTATTHFTSNRRTFEICQCGLSHKHVTPTEAAYQASVRGEPIAYDYEKQQWTHGAAALALKERAKMAELNQLNFAGEVLDILRGSKEWNRRNTLNAIIARAQARGFEIA